MMVIVDISGGDRGSAGQQPAGELWAVGCELAGAWMGRDA